MFKAVARTTLHENILAQLYDAIETGEWSPGTRIPGEIALAGQFDVSRNCIREAIKVLASRRIVETKPGSGTFLSENARDLLRFARKQEYIFEDVNFKELMETRCLVEGQIAYYAAARGTEKEFEELEPLLCDTPDPAMRYQAHIRFHGGLVRIAWHALLERMWSSIHDEISVQREFYFKWSVEGSKNLLRNHIGILSCLRERNPHCAREAMIEHITSVWLDIFKVPLDI